MRATWPIAKRAPATTLAFPNHSRAFDATRRAVRFWGHDSAMEVSFFVTEDALRRVVPDIGGNEAGFLAAFDGHRELILAVAVRVYMRGHKGSYDIVPTDF
jgi:hypothetical protein